MRAYIFMNHHVHKQPAGELVEPVITIQAGKRRLYANKVAINGPCVVATGHLKQVKSHTVKAWIACNSSDVQVIE